MRIKTLLGIALAGLLAASPLKAQDSLEGSLDNASTYFWRGKELLKGWMGQPSVTLNRESLSTGLWANYDYKTGKITEIDYSLGTERELRDMAVAGGFTLYGYPDDTPSTLEVNAGLTAALLLSPSIRLYHDFMLGSYAELSAKHSFGLLRLEVTPSALVGYNHYYDCDISGFSHCELSLSWDVPFFFGTSVSHRLAHSFPISEGFDRKTYVTVGLNL